MHFCKGLGQVAIAFIGDDDAGAVFGDQEIRPGNANLCGEIFLPQTIPRLIGDVSGLSQVPIGVQAVMGGPKSLADLFLGDMHRRNDDVAWRLIAQLDDVLT